MATHETANLEEFAELTGIIIRALPRAIEGLDMRETLKLAATGNEQLSGFLREVLTSLKKPTLAQNAEESALEPAIPADNVEFELTLDATDPMEMIRGDGYNTKGWKFTGSVVVPQTRKFKLVRVGFCSNLDEVRKKLAKHGSVPEGQWREAFKKAFPRNNGQGAIGFADPSWVHPDGYADFPVLSVRGKDWHSYFDWSGLDHDESWRWFVASK